MSWEQSRIELGLPPDTMTCSNCGRKMTLQMDEFGYYYKRECGLKLNV